MIKKLFFLVAAVLIAVAGSGTGTTDADEPEATVTLCELYDRFRDLEEAFGAYADIVDGIRCQEGELECDTGIIIPEGTWVDEDEWKEDEWTIIPYCHKNPCVARTVDIASMVENAGKAATTMHAAMAALLAEVESKEITFLSRTGPRPKK